MREPRRDAGLVEQHGDEVRVLGQVRQQPLDDDQLLEAAGAGLARDEQLSHAARRQLAQERVLAECGARVLVRKDR